MAKLNRLPNGYKKIVDKYKKYLKNLLNSMENLSDVGGHPHSIDTKISTFSMHVEILNRSYDKFGALNIHFKKGCIEAEALVDRNGKWKLSKTCTVNIEGTNDYIENYNWFN